MRKTKVINLLGAPGTGKSIVAAHLFAMMKFKGLNVELVLEYAKDLVYEQRNKTITNQQYVFGKQGHRLFRLREDVDYIITDSPLILSQFYNSVYGDKSEQFKQNVLHEMSKYENINFLLNRTKPYDPKGRYQTEVQADEFALKIKELLDEVGETYTQWDVNEELAPKLAELLETVNN